MENTFLFLTRLSALSLPPSDFLAQARFSPSEFSRFVSSPWQTFPFPPYSPNGRSPRRPGVRRIRFEKRKLTSRLFKKPPLTRSPVPPFGSKVQLERGPGAARKQRRRRRSLAPRSRVVVQSRETLGRLAASPAPAALASLFGTNCFGQPVKSLEIDYSSKAS